MGKVKFKNKPVTADSNVTPPVSAVSLAPVSIEVSPIKFHNAHESNFDRDKNTVQSRLNPEMLSHLNKVYSPTKGLTDDQESSTFDNHERTNGTILESVVTTSRVAISSEYSREYTSGYSSFTPVGDKAPTYSHNLGSILSSGSNTDYYASNSTPSPQPRQMNLFSIDNKPIKPSIITNSFDYLGMSLPVNKPETIPKEQGLTVASDDIHSKITASLHMLASHIDDSIKKSHSMKMSIAQIDSAIDEEINRFLNN